MVEGRLGKIAKELALLEQPFIKDNTKTVGEHIKEAVAAIGENIQVRPRAFVLRFSKYKRDAILVHVLTSLVSRLRSTWRPS